MTSDPSGGTADHIETFIRAAKKAFEGMMGVKITRADVQRHSELAKGFDVSAIIGLTDLSSPQRETGLRPNGIRVDRQSPPTNPHPDRGAHSGRYRFARCPGTTTDRNLQVDRYPPEREAT